MFGVPPIEKRIEKVKKEVEEVESNIASVQDNFERALRVAQANEERLKHLVGTRNEHLSRLGELSLLRDVRDRKLLVLDLEQMEPAKIAFV